MMLPLFHCLYPSRAVGAVLQSSQAHKICLRHVSVPIVTHTLGEFPPRKPRDWHGRRDAMRCDTAVLFVSNRLRMDGNARVWVLAKEAFPRRSFIMCFVWACWQRRPLFYRAGPVSYHNVRHRLIDMNMHTLQLDVSELKGAAAQNKANRGSRSQD
ncbi:hypothetical protein CCHR01_06078 [Colletotrichum chrysophilum]|uniref:Uncharacterized protein n=1 Tax=Colletotrichum chrysophilum TaxID=1836956 RepID=A0AAD9AMN9_9PEZI|nr:hypothetical protein CCHR01_06078 [Colletotrichum chrysophilum]